MNFAALGVGTASKLATRNVILQCDNVSWPHGDVHGRSHDAGSCGRCRRWCRMYASAQNWLIVPYDAPVFLSRLSVVAGEDRRTGKRDQ